MCHREKRRGRRRIGKVCVRGVPKVTSDDNVPGGVRVKDVELVIGIVIGIECHPEQSSFTACRQKAADIEESGCEERPSNDIEYSNQPSLLDDEKARGVTGRRSHEDR